MSTDEVRLMVRAAVLMVGMGEALPIAGTTVMGRDEHGYWVEDNGEVVNGLSKKQAVRIAIENLTNDKENN